MTLLAEAEHATQCAEKTALLHHYFERAVELWPDRTAVDVPPGVGRPQRRLVTYAELGELSDALAYHLRRCVENECVVAVLLPRRTEHMYSSQLAVLKTGAAYACIDPSFPDEQVRDILADSEAVALLTDEAGRARAARIGFDEARVFNVAELTETISDAVVAPPQPSWLYPNSLAYVIYTSGTTGRPKGVMIEHASISNLIESNIEEFALTPHDRVGQCSSNSFDASIEEVWLAFSAGATVVVMDEETTRLGPDLIPWLRRERITVLSPPPTLLRTTGCLDPETALPELSLLYVGGEALPEDIADRWARGRLLVNAYGPTECTVTSVRGRVQSGEPVAIGRPVRGFQAWVLDESLKEVKDGERGELCLGGMGLARGYRNRPELTASKFPLHPVFGRIYRTGDLVHCDKAGRLFYHGRIDAQVKIRGHRVELEAIEARLSECAGVREAACRVQGFGAQQTLVAYVVPEDQSLPLSFDDLKASLRDLLPAYMIPGHFQRLSELPTTIGGKLDRKALPDLELQIHTEERQLVAPGSKEEEHLAEAFRVVLQVRNGLSVHDDFFNDLGGDSLSAAELISRLRDEPATSGLTVRDLYEARTVAELAKRLNGDSERDAASHAQRIFSQEIAAIPVKVRPILATLVQVLWLLTGLALGSIVLYLISFRAVPFLSRSLGLIPFLLLAPFLLFAALLLYTPFSILLAVFVKRVLVGHYRPLRAPVWGSFYVRNWMVQQTLRVVPWRILGGTVFQQMVLRALGARIGRRVHIHRGVNLMQGGWDLLEIGDDVTLGQDAALRLVELEDGHVIVGPVALGSGCTLAVRAGVSSHTILESDAYLTTLSYLPRGGRIPRGELWDGVPARPSGPSPAQPTLRDNERTLSPFRHGVTLILARFGLDLLLALPFELVLIFAAVHYGVDAESALDWLSAPSFQWPLLLTGILLTTLPVPLTLALEAILARAMGRVWPGRISRWSPAYVRVWLKSELVTSASEWVSGTLYWPIWLRLAGMKVGRCSEVSTVIDVVPELVEVGRESFFADGIYLGGPEVHRGTVMLSRTRLAKNTFIGNHAVVPGGQTLPRDILIGICTVADETRMRPSTSWFGHPPFELPRREVVECDRRLTHEPSLVRYLSRLFWETLRFALPVVPALTLAVCLRLLASSEGSATQMLFLFALLPSLVIASGAFLCLFVLALKWALLGRVRPGHHPLWSCWTNRWDFLYVAWGFYARGALSALEGTLLLSWYLRAMGAEIGRRVVLGGGFAQVVDPDMLHFEDGATVSCQFQAHTFEDRVLKIDHVRIRRGATVGESAVLLYGADVGAGAYVAPHSVVMKRESLLPGRSYAGCPTRPDETEDRVTKRRSKL